jgi:hypothetical protein
LENQWVHPQNFRLRICSQNPPADFKNRQFPYKLVGSGPKVTTGMGGGNGVGRHLVPPLSQQGILLFASFSLVVGDLGCFIDEKCSS